MYYLVLDLEYSRISKNNTPHQRWSYIRTMQFEIIQLGCILLDKKFNYKQHFDMYTKLYISNSIDKNVELLTGITDLILQKYAIDFKQAINKIENEILSKDITILTWGNSDKPIINKHTKWYFPKRKTIFNKKPYIDVQKNVRHILMFDQMPSLQTVAKIYNCNVMRDKYHSAVDDTYVLADIVRKIGIGLIIEVNNIKDVFKDLDNIAKVINDVKKKFNFIKQTNYYIDNINKKRWVGVCLINNKPTAVRIIANNRKYEYEIVEDVVDVYSYVDQIDNALMSINNLNMRKRNKERRKMERKLRKNANFSNED